MRIGKRCASIGLAVTLCGGLSLATAPSRAQDTPGGDESTQESRPADSANESPSETPSSPEDQKSGFPVVPSPMGPLLWGNTWDAVVELGGGIDPEARGRFFGRARGGMMWAREPFFVALGATAEVGPYAPFAAGLQVEVAHIWTGLWANMGASLDMEGRPAALLGAGWSIFGAEARYQSLGEGESTWALFGKLWLPIRHLVFALTR